MSGARDCAGGWPAIAGGVSGPKRRHAVDGSVTASGAAVVASGVVPPACRHDGSTTSLTVVGFGTRHKDQLIAGAVAPSGETTRGVAVTPAPGGASGGSKRTAAMRGAVNRDEGAPKSGRQPTAATATTSGATTSVHLKIAPWRRRPRASANR